MQIIILLTLLQLIHKYVVLYKLLILHHSLFYAKIFKSNEYSYNFMFSNKVFMYINL